MAAPKPEPKKDADKKAKDDTKKISASDVKTWNMKCKISPSLLSNNLTSSGNYLCYVSRNESHSRNEVHVVKESADDILHEKPGTPLIAILPDKDTIAQARYFRLQGLGDVLVVITHTGAVAIHDETGQKQLHSYKLQKATTHAKELHLQGIASDGTRVFIGAGNGEILVFSTKQKLILAKKYPGHRDAITDLSYSETGTSTNPTGVLVTGDASGAVAIWDDVKESLTKAVDLPTAGAPVTSIRTGYGYAVVAFASGQIRLIDLKTKKLAIEITAHTRSISAVDIHPTKPIFATTSEDTYTTIWTLPTATNKKIKNVLCASLGHSLFTGLQFSGKYGGTSATSTPLLTATTPAVTIATNNLICVVGLDTKFLNFLPIPPI